MMPVLRKIEGSWRCPFCDGYFLAGEDFVGHSIPYCATFDSMSAIDFIAAARKEIVGPMPWDSDDRN